MRIPILLCLFLICTLSFGKVTDGDSIPMSHRSRKIDLPRFRIDTSYALPFLTIHLGGALAFTDGRITLNSENNRGSEIDMENDLNFPATQLIPRFNFFLRVTKKHHFLLDLYSVRRKENFVLNQDIQYGESVFSAATEVRSKFHVTTFSFAYKHSFINRPQYDLGGLVGITALNYALRIEDANHMEREGLFLPVPLLGIDGYVFITKRIYVRGVAKFFMAKRNNLDYTLFSFKPFVEYYFTDKFGAGIRYQYVYSSVDKISNKAFDGSFRYQFNAVSLFACLRFY